MLVTGGRIMAVGALEDIQAAAPSGGAQRVDLAGKVAVPGFNDSHLHLLNWGAWAGRGGPI